MRLEQLIKFCESGAQFAKQLHDLYYVAIRFLNRGLEKHNPLCPPLHESFALANFDFPFDVLRDSWCFEGRDKLHKTLKKQLLTEFKRELGVANHATKITIGQGHLGDQALYSAWKIFPYVRKNLYLIFMRTARYSITAAWLFEGDINAYLTPEKIGTANWNEPQEKDIRYEIQEVEGRKTIAIKRKVTIEDFDSLFKLLLEKELLSSNS